MPKKKRCGSNNNTKSHQKPFKLNKIIKLSALNQTSEIPSSQNPKKTGSRRKNLKPSVRNMTTEREKQTK